MGSVTICSDFGAQEEEIYHNFHLFPFYVPCNNGSKCHELSCCCCCCFVIFSFKMALLLFSFTLIQRLFSSFLLSAIRVVTSAYLRLLMLLPPALILACNPASPGFLMMCSAYKLNKQGDSRQPCHTPFLILKQSVAPHRVVTVAS